MVPGPSRCRRALPALAPLSPSSLSLSILLLTLAIAGVSAPPAAGALPIETVAGVAHVHNGPTPREGRTTLTARELWRAGGEDDEDVFFGAISGVTADASGRLYVCDAQLNQVFVFSAAGQFLRALSREGDGPGEIRRPRDLLLWPDGTIGIVLGFPGRIVKLHADGTPAGEFRPGADDPTAGGMRMLDGAQLTGDGLLVCGRSMTREGETMGWTRFLSLFGMDGSERVRYLDRSSETDIGRRRFVERDSYFVDGGRWDQDEQGLVYAAPERDAYAVHVFAPDGTLLRVIEREFRPWHRDQQDKDRIGDSVVMVINGERVQPELEIEADDPAIMRLHTDREGSLWVLPSRGVREQPDGVLMTWDVFTPEGEFARQVAVVCPGDPQRDSFRFLEDGRLVVMRGAIDARQSMWGGGEGDQEEAVPLEVVCYALDPASDR
jgi:hypothetical protein